MTHIYLTETIIRDALKARTITEREAKELTRTLKRCQSDRNRIRQGRIAS
jgi:hypothetical protein